MNNTQPDESDNCDENAEAMNDDFSSDSSGDEGSEPHRFHVSDAVKGFASSSNGTNSQGCGDEIEQTNATCDTNKGNSNQLMEDDYPPPTAADFQSREFATIEDAYKFYVRYAQSVGFGVRKGDVGRNKRRQLTRQSFFCCKQGLRNKKHYMRDDRKRQPKLETRTNCKARVMLHLKKGSSSWKVRKFVEDHNHELTPERFVHLIRNHRHMTTAHKSQTDTMNKHGMQTSQIMGFMAGRGSGFGGIGFSKKDLYNYIDKGRRCKIVDGDADAAISYLEGRADADGMTVARYTITDDNRLGNLFWSGGLCRVDYQYFGDVIAFDSTYKKNKYDKPLVIFSGVNHHRQTSIFGFALLGDERIETYQWLLEQFLEVMANKEPSVVVTDDDDAMREAIRRVFPRATHRLCAWHLHKNALANIKEPEFCEAFKKCIDANITRSQFENFWRETVERFRLGDNQWVTNVYEKKEMWATAYLCEKFCAGIRTTSRCEEIHCFITRFIKAGYSILELVQSLERVLKEYRNNELEAQFQSINTFPVYDSGLHSIEVAAAKVYTRSIFKEVKQEMVNVSSLVMVNRESFSTTVKYQFCKFGQPHRLFDVFYDRLGDNNEPKIRCDCHFWNMNGIPCSHVFFVMKNERIPELPSSLILRRWRKDAKTFDDDDNVGDDNRRQILRYGTLCFASLWMSYLASKSGPHFRKTMNVIVGITSELESKTDVVVNGGVASSKHIGDPVLTKTKGAPQVKKNETKKQLCSNCGMPDHTNRNCPRLNGHISSHSDDAFSDKVGTHEENYAQSERVPTSPGKSNQPSRVDPQYVPPALTHSNNLNANGNMVGQ